MGEEECFVYVFKNTKTNNVKVGITNNIINRLRALNRDNPEIEFYLGNKNLPLYFWSGVKAYKTKNYTEVEKLAHKNLKNYEDTDSPIGEVFSCTIEIAIQAIEDALKDLNLFDEATVFEESQLYY